MITKGLLPHHPSAQTIWQATGRLGTHAKLLVARISKKDIFSKNSKSCFLSWEPAGAVHPLWTVKENPPGLEPQRDLMH